MRQWLAGLGPLFEMIENLSDDGRVFDTGNHFNSTTALLAGFDLEHVPSTKTDGEAFVH